MIQQRTDRQRGCGWRKPGGLYLAAPATGVQCGALPLALTRCPCCDAGIKPSRSWTWVQVDALLGPAVAACPIGQTPPFGDCNRCAANFIRGRHGLLWIGEAFYPTPEYWMQEARAQGISRRIPAVPKGFVVGETWVLVAHRKAIRNADGTYTPGLFQMFRPSAVEYVVKGSETSETLVALEKRGITPVAVTRDDSGLFTPQVEE
jgi:hypothetical protein